MNKTIGVILIVARPGGPGVRRLQRYTTREKVIDLGPIHASRDETHSFPLPPIAGALLLVGGVVLVARRS